MNQINWFGLTELSFEKKKDFFNPPPNHMGLGGGGRGGGGFEITKVGQLSRGMPLQIFPIFIKTFCI